MQATNLSFAKIVSTPTVSTWSQAYNAGSLFVVVSLSGPEEEDAITLTNTGKQIISSLEAEFFTLETKSLATIKEAIHTSLSNLPEYVTASMELAFVKEQVLYIFLHGAGRIIMKRGDSIGILLTCEEASDETLSASGIIKQNDLIILQSDQFTELIPEQELKKSLDLTLPSDIAEALSPRVHNSENGGAAAIIITITGVPAQTTESQNQDTKEVEEEEIDNPKEEHPDHTSPVNIIKKIHIPSLAFMTKYLHRPRFSAKPLKNIQRFALLAAAILLVALLSFGIYSTLQNRQQQELQKKFNAVYTEAENKYEEAQGIKSITPDKAQSLMQSASEQIAGEIGGFPATSTQHERLAALQQKIRAQISQQSEIKQLKADAVDAKDSTLLQALLDHKDAVSTAEDDNSVYILTATSVISKDKTNGKEKTVIKNEKDWQDGIAINAYHGNIYILDKQNGIIKFIAAASGYGKADYFQDTKPDLTKAVSMTIDGSIWILFADAHIAKYTKGVQEAFAVRLPDALRKQAQIFTNIDMDSIYILDTGSSIITQIQKDGTVKNKFQATVIASARAFTVDSDEQTAYVLSGGKVWKLDLQ